MKKMKNNKGKIKRLLDALRLRGTAEIVDLFYNIIISAGGTSSAASINYSPLAQDTGIKWIDGDPVYQITFDSLTENFTIPDFKTAIEINAVTQRINSNQIIFVNVQQSMMGQDMNLITSIDWIVEDIYPTITSFVAGSTTEIQYNDNGVFGSDAGFKRKPDGFFTFQEGYGVLNAEVSLGNGDFTDEGLAIFAGGNLFFDDDTSIFVLAGDLTDLTGDKSALTRVQEGDDTGAVFTSSGGAVLYYEGLIESSTVLAGQTEALLKFEGPTLTTEVSVNDNGIQILYDGV
jgi:hypothetical protein